eukprot:1677023-Prymnesium_polylepis.1
MHRSFPAGTSAANRSERALIVPSASCHSKTTVGSTAGPTTSFSRHQSARSASRTCGLSGHAGAWVPSRAIAPSAEPPAAASLSASADPPGSRKRCSLRS